MRHVWLVALCGCRSILGIEDVVVNDAPPGDGSTVFDDAPDDAFNPGQICYGKSVVRACLDVAPSNTLVLATSVIDTSVACTFVQPQAGPPSLCVIAAKSIVVPSGVGVRVIGPRPLLFLATDAIQVDGTIDASSLQAGGTGAGANTGACSIAGTGGNALGGTNGGGGGAGGSLGSIGGRGGTGDGGVMGGNSSAPVPITVFRGGCAGARGGNAAASAGGVGGAGGGAVYLLAGSSIAIMGTINASGAAGRAGGTRTGGGGGGAGGMIGLEAPTMTIGLPARIFAIGGGGASGSSSTTTGVDGNEATTTAAPGQVAGPGGSGAGGSGGVAAGGNGGNAAGPGAGGGGGGGGGSAGVIWTVPMASGGTFVPAPTVP